MNSEDLSRLYLGYIDSLNRQDWPNLERFVVAQIGQGQ